MKRHLFLIFFQLFFVHQSCVKRLPPISDTKEEDLSSIPPRYRHQIGKVLFKYNIDKVALKLCENGLSPSCLRISRELQDKINKEKDQIKKDQIYWAKYYYDLAACLLKDSRGCYNAARFDIFMINNGVDRKNSAMYLLEKSCQFQNPEACHEVGLWELNEGSKEHSLGYFAQACRLNMMNACFMGAKIADELKHSDIAFNMHNKSCEMGDKKSCYNAGVLAFEMGEVQLATKIWDNSCENKQASSCYNLACLLFATKVPDKIEKAYHFLELSLKYGMEKAVVEFDDDLNSYRKEYRFMKLMSRYVK